MPELRLASFVSSIFGAPVALGFGIGHLVSVRLEELCRASREAVDEHKRRVPLGELERAVADQPEPRPFSEALSRPGTSLIAEYKRRSPSAGVIREDADVAELVRSYERGGGAAPSILTEERHFGGALDDLRARRDACDLPVLPDGL